MAAEPINVFSRKIDPRGVVQFLRMLVPDLQVVGPEDSLGEDRHHSSQRLAAESDRADIPPRPKIL